jgi:hypothetical protein
MKNRINILFIFLLPIFILVIFAFPKTTFASWWNPFSWFKKEVRVEQQISFPVIQTEAIVTSDNNTQKDIKEEKKTVSVIKPKKIIQEPPAVKQEVEVKKEITPIVETVKENYKLEDVVKEWRPYTVRVTCITLDANGNKKSYSDGSGFLAYDPARGPSVITNKHVFYVKDGVSTNYCDVYFPENKADNFVHVSTASQVLITGSFKDQVLSPNFDFAGVFRGVAVVSLDGTCWEALVKRFEQKAIIRKKDF